jgi:hypothetical protein
MKRKARDSFPSWRERHARDLQIRVKNDNRKKGSLAIVSPFYVIGSQPCYQRVSFKIDGPL